MANVYNDPTAWIAIGRINKAERQKQEQERQSKRGKTFERYYEKEIKAHGKR